MHKKWISALYSLNIIFQSFFSLLSPIAVMLLLAFLSVEKLGAPNWAYVPFIILGVFSGLFSMVRFILVASRSVNALEEEHKRTDEERRKITEKRGNLSKKTGSEKENGNS